MTAEHWYRFEDYMTVPTVDEFERSVGECEVIICLRRYKIMKQTPKGVWLEYGYEKDKFVLRDARKRFACPTIEEAKISFIARKKRQLGILEVQAKDVRKVLVLAESIIRREVLAYDRTISLG